MAQTALKFDGTQNYVEIPNNSNYSVPTTGALTISFWMRLDALDFTTTIASPEGPYVNFIGKGDYLSPTQFEWLFRIYSAGYSSNSSLRPSRISFYLFNLNGGLGVGSFFQDGLTVGQVIHVVGKVDANNTYIYKNGVLRKTDLYNGTITPQNGIAPVRIGTTSLGDPGFFNGAINNVRIYNSALSDTEVNNIYLGNPTATGLVGKWNFDEGSGTSAADTSGNGNNGTLNGTPKPLWDTLPYTNYANNQYRAGKVGSDMGRSEGWT